MVGTIVGFLIGPTRGVDPWIVVLAAVGVLAVIDRSLPWRRIPVTTAVAVALVAFVGSLVVPEGSTKWVADVEGGGAVAGTVVAGAGLANLVNNLPALVIGLEGVSEVSPGVWAWLLGVNTGAALLPTGALANLLWWRIARDEGVVVEVAHYVRATAPVVTPALAVSALVAAVVISVR